MIINHKQFLIGKLNINLIIIVNHKNRSSVTLPKSKQNQSRLTSIIKGILVDKKTQINQKNNNITLKNLYISLFCI